MASVVPMFMEFFIIRDGQQTGPVTEDVVQAMLKNGTLSPNDMGWRKGLPAWLPLMEVLSPGTARPTEPPPMSGIHSNGKARPATARQKALLQYIGSPLNGSTTREEAAMAISDALENPKLTSRLVKWGEEKLRLHPDLFQEEIDYRRGTRIGRYLELCQTEGAEVVKDVTKAHVQVLIESLDKRYPAWEQDSRAALWDYLLPTVAEHFPQLVQEEWKGKLRMGGTLKVAAAYARTPSGHLLPPDPPSAFQAALRGIVYGVFALGLVIGAIYLFRDKSGPDVVRNEAAPVSDLPKAPANPSVAKVEETPVEVDATVQPPVAVSEVASPAPPSASTTPSANPAPVNPNEGSNPTLVAEAAPMAEAPVAAAPTPAKTPATTFSPAPPPPGTPPAEPTPAVPAAPEPTVRNAATLTQPVTVQLQFGKVTLNPGTKVRLIAIEGQNVRVNFNNNIVLMPIASTDIDPANTVVAQPPVAAPAAPVSTPALIQPTAPTAPKSPSDDL